MYISTYLKPLLLFQLPNDMENYIRYQVMGSVSQIRMKSGCIPTRFECQPDRRKRTSNTTERPYALKKQRRILIEESEKDFAEKNTPTKHLEPASTSECLGRYLLTLECQQTTFYYIGLKCIFIEFACYSYLLCYRSMSLPNILEKWPTLTMGPAGLASMWA